MRCKAGIGLALIAAAFAACGSEDGEPGGDSTDVEKIERVLKEATTSKDLEVLCVTVPTRSYVERFYGDVAQCRKAEKRTRARVKAAPTDARVTDTEVDGDTATATVELVGGYGDGAQGTVDLKKENGAWKLDDENVDFLRSQVMAVVRSTELGKDPKVRSCIENKFNSLDDTAIRKFAYDVGAERPQAERRLRRFFSKCLLAGGSTSGDATSTTDPTSGQGDSFLRRAFDKDIAEALEKEGSSAREISCVKQNLRDSFSDHKIAELAADGSMSEKELRSAAVAAVTECEGRG